MNDSPLDTSHRNVSRAETVAEALLARMRILAATADPAPSLSYDLARAAFSMRTLDTELAELAWDSAQDAAELTGVRGGSDTRMLSFETPSVAIELQVDAHGSHRTLIGQVVGIATTGLHVETDCRTTRADVDDLGCFRIVGLAPGPTRLRLTARDGTTITTSWVTL